MPRLERRSGSERGDRLWSAPFSISQLAHREVNELDADGGQGGEREYGQHWKQKNSHESSLSERIETSRRNRRTFSNTATREPTAFQPQMAVFKIGVRTARHNQTMVERSLTVHSTQTATSGYPDRSCDGATPGVTP